MPATAMPTTAPVPGVVAMALGPCRRRFPAAAGIGCDPRGLWRAVRGARR
jgi:hypothetical protein